MGEGIPPEPNLTKEQSRVLHRLRNDSIVILPGDKGNTMVVMDAPEYLSKINDVLSDRNYDTEQGPHKEAQED